MTSALEKNNPSALEREKNIQTQVHYTRDAQVLIKRKKCNHKGTPKIGTLGHKTINKRDQKDHKMIKYK